MKKYRLVYDIPRVNELYAEGYRLHSMEVEHSFKDGTTQLMARPIYMMSLQEPSKYDDVAFYKKVPITYEAQAVEAGWRIIHHTAKAVVVVKDRVPPTEAEE